MQRTEIKKIAAYLWEIPKSHRGDMRVAAQIYATETMLAEMLRDRSLDQLVNVACIPGIVGRAIVMPDAHEGYGFPIGGVAATKYPDGVISPGGIGYDINCGVRLIKSRLTADDIKNHLDELGAKLDLLVPSGVGRGGSLKLNDKDLDGVLKNGAGWMVRKGFGEGDDLERTESGGCLEEADPSVVSVHAKNRGRDQIGTMGAGNHFVEVDRVDEIFDDETARDFGLFKGQIVILIHTGSRGLGHQVATDYIRLMMDAMIRYGISVPDPELACAPLSSNEGADYFAAMSAAANFAWANRQMITHEVRQAWEDVFGTAGGGLALLYDVAHNIAKIETHLVAGNPCKLIVHRKGATRAFGPGRPDLPSEYSQTGQPVLIPGSMGTSSYVLAGTAGSMEKTFGSTCHGAGRRLSRHAALKQVRGADLRAELENAGIHIQSRHLRGLAEEAPEAYKDIENVVEVVHKAGIARKVARIRPVIVVKG